MIGIVGDAFKPSEELNKLEKIYGLLVESYKSLTKAMEIDATRDRYKWVANRTKMQSELNNVMWSYQERLANQIYKEMKEQGFI